MSKRSRVRFVHGDVLALDEAGFPDASVDVVLCSEVLHEMPNAGGQQLLRSVFRALKPGGVFAIMDINATQVLRDITVGNLALRLALKSEPYLDQYLDQNLQSMLLDEGFDRVETSWLNKSKNVCAKECSLSIIISEKPLHAV